MAKKAPTVVSILNLKGGVGKTTVAALLARHACGAGGYSESSLEEMDVLAVDLDPQANLSQALMGEGGYQKFMKDKEPGVVELFNDFAPTSRTTSHTELVQPEHVVKRVPTPPSAKGSLTIIPSRFDFSDKLIRSVSTDEMILAKFISREMMGKDLIIIDCAPTESILTRAAYHASRYVLIPVKTEFFSTIGFPLMKESLDNFCANNRAHHIQVCGVLVHHNRTSGQSPGPHHRTSLHEINDLAREYSWPVLSPSMYHSDGYPKLAKDIYATWTGNAPSEWPAVAQAILFAVGRDTKRAIQ